MSDIFSEIVMLSISLPNGKEAYVVKGTYPNESICQMFKPLLNTTVKSINVEVVEKDPRLAKVTLESCFDENDVTTETVRYLPTTSLTWTETSDTELIEVVTNQYNDYEKSKEEEYRAKEKEEERNRMIPTRL